MGPPRRSLFAEALEGVSGEPAAANGWLARARRLLDGQGLARLNPNIAPEG